MESKSCPCNCKCGYCYCCQQREQAKWDAVAKRVAEVMPQRLLVAFTNEMEHDDSLVRMYEADWRNAVLEFYRRLFR